MLSFVGGPDQVWLKNASLFKSTYSLVEYLHCFLLDCSYVMFCKMGRQTSAFY